MKNHSGITNINIYKKAYDSSIVDGYSDTNAPFSGQIIEDYNCDFCDELGICQNEKNMYHGKICEHKYTCVDRKAANLEMGKKQSKKAVDLFRTILQIFFSNPEELVSEKNSRLILAKVNFEVESQKEFINLLKELSAREKITVPVYECEIIKALHNIQGRIEIVRQINGKPFNTDMNDEEKITLSILRRILMMCVYANKTEINEMFFHGQKPLQTFFNWGNLRGNHQTSFLSDSTAYEKENRENVNCFKKFYGITKVSKGDSRNYFDGDTEKKMPCFVLKEKKTGEIKLSDQTNAYVYTALMIPFDRFYTEEDLRFDFERYANSKFKDDFFKYALMEYKNKPVYDDLYGTGFIKQISKKEVAVCFLDFMTMIIYYKFPKDFKEGKIKFINQKEWNEEKRKITAYWNKTYKGNNVVIKKYPLEQTGKIVEFLEDKIVIEWNHYGYRRRETYPYPIQEDNSLEIVVEWK